MSKTADASTAVADAASNRSGQPSPTEPAPLHQVITLLAVTRPCRIRASAAIYR
jgi:hypothetical protein